MASRDAQKARVQIPVGSNTTIVGLGNDARDSRRAARPPRRVRPTSAATSSSATSPSRTRIDCFPPGRRPTGRTAPGMHSTTRSPLRQTHHVWIDHNTFEDCGHDRQQRAGLLRRALRAARRADRYHQRLELRDGLLEPVPEPRQGHADRVLGSVQHGDRDRGKLKVTIHHNLFLNLGQRTPRVRFGQVHVYNNYYNIDHSPAISTVGASASSRRSMRRTTTSRRAT